MQKIQRTGGAGGSMSGAAIKAAYEAESDTNALTDDNLARLEALLNVEAGADITDFENVTASGAVMGASGKKYQIVSAVLRQDNAGSGWYAINDAGHAPVGLDPVTPVELLDGKIKVNYAFTAKMIGSFLITPDEGYSNSNLTFGASVGKSSSIISLHHPFWFRASGTSKAAHSYFGDMATDATLSDGQWYAEHDTANGLWTVKHPTESHNDAAGSVVCVEGYGDDKTASFYEVTARAKSSFDVEARQAVHGLTSASSVISDNAGPQTMSWDGVSTLTITHPECASVNDAIVVSKNALFPAVVTASSTTSITVQFLDAASGALYVGGSLPTNVRYQRGSNAACALTGSTKFKAERLGRCKVNAENVGGASSNLWVLGLFELN